MLVLLLPGLIFGVTVINAVIGFIQEGRVEKALAALAHSVSSEVTVLQGAQQRVSSTALVPGDVVLLAAGDKILADLRLFRAKELQAIESALTGESAAVAKHCDVLPEDTLLADRGNMAYAGTFIVEDAGVLADAPQGPDAPAIHQGADRLDAELLGLGQLANKVQDVCGLDHLVVRQDHRRGRASVAAVQHMLVGEGLALVGDSAVELDLRLEGAPFELGGFLPDGHIGVGIDRLSESSGSG